MLLSPLADIPFYLTVHLLLVSSPDPTYERGSGDIRLIPRDYFQREISLRQSHCRKHNL